MRRRLLALMVVSGMALMTACSGSSQPEKTTAAQTAAKEEKAVPESTEAPKAEASEESKEESGGGKVYGYITPGPDTWYQRNVEGFQMGAEKDGNKVVVLNSDYDVSKEVSNIDSMINQGVDGLCIFSFNESGAKIAAEKCAKAGIPLVSTDSVGTALDNNGNDIVAAIDFDWTEMGNNYGQWFADNCPGENIFVITGNFESVPCQRINEAMQAKVDELGKNKIIDIQEGEYNPSKAITVAQDAIASGKDFSVIFVMNEDMAAGIIQMLDSQGVADQYKVVSQNGSPAGLPLIKNGKLAYTISSSPGWEGLVSYQVLNQYATGKNTAVQQQVELPIMPVDQSNIDDKTDKRVFSGFSAIMNGLDGGSYESPFIDREGKEFGKHIIHGWNLQILFRHTGTEGCGPGAGGRADHMPGRGKWGRKIHPDKNTFRG